MTGHPAGRFDGLRLVPDPEPPDPTETERQRNAIAASLTETADALHAGILTMTDPTAFVLVMVGADSAMVTWIGEPDDIVDCAAIGLGATTVAGKPGRDVVRWVSHERRRRVAFRARAAAEQAVYEIEHPWLCECGKRCKTERGLVTHSRSHRVQT